MRRALLLMSCCLSVAGAPQLQAVGGTIVDQNVWLTYSSAHWGPHPGAGLYGVDAAAANPLYRSGWWYRVEGVDTREFPFPAPESESYSNGKLTATWTNVDGKGFAATETTWVFDDEGPSGGFASEIFIDWRPTGATSHNVTLFHFLDVDVAGSFTNDSAVMRGPGFMKITDGASTMRYRGSGAQQHYRVAPYDNTYGGDIKRRLNDTAVDNLTDTGLPFGPGDFTGAYQFTSYTPYGGANISVSSNLRRDYVRGQGDAQGVTPWIFFKDGLGIEHSGRFMMRRTSSVQGYGAYAIGREFLTVNDFDGDGDEDGLFRDVSTNALSIYGRSLGGNLNVPPLQSDLKLAATADFDGDGKADILWRNTTTQKLAIWLMNGPSFLGHRFPNPDQAADANWEVVGADDFNADGFNDLLFYNQTSGRLVVWNLDANQVRIAGGFTNPASVGSNVWRAVAVGDFGRGAPGANGPAPHGSPDVLWQNDVSKKLVVWHMDFAANRTSGLFVTPDSCGFCNGDGTVFGPR